MIEGALPPDRQRIAEEFKTGINTLFSTYEGYVEYRFTSPENPETVEELALEGSIVGVPTSFMLQRGERRMLSFFDSLKPPIVITSFFSDDNGDIQTVHNQFPLDTAELPNDSTNSVIGIDDALAQELETVYPSTEDELLVVLQEAQQATPSVPFTKLVERFVDRTFLVTEAIGDDESREALTHFKGSVSEYLQRNESSIQQSPASITAQYGLLDPKRNREYTVMVTQTKLDELPAVMLTYRDEAESVEVVYGTKPEDRGIFFGQVSTLFPEQGSITRPLGMSDAKDVSYFLKNPRYE